MFWTDLVKNDLADEYVPFDTINVKGNMNNTPDKRFTVVSKDPFVLSEDYRDLDKCMIPK